MIDFKLDENGKYRYVIYQGVYYPAKQILYAPEQLGVIEPEIKLSTGQVIDNKQ